MQQESQINHTAYILLHKGLQTQPEWLTCARSPLEQAGCLFSVWRPSQLGTHSIFVPPTVLRGHPALQHRSPCTTTLSTSALKAFRHSTFSKLQEGFSISNKLCALFLYILTLCHFFYKQEYLQIQGKVSSCSLRRNCLKKNVVLENRS